MLCLPFNSGNINDQTPNGFTGLALNSPTAVTDRLGNAFGAYQFNGTTQFLKYGDILDSVFCKSPAAKFTITGWAKTTTVNPTLGAGLIVSKQAGGAGPDEWSVSHFNDGTVRGIVKTSAVSDYVEWKTASVIPTNTWFFFTLMFNGTATNPLNRVILYVNAAPTTLGRTNGTFSTFCANSNQEITIGAGHLSALPNTASNQYNGAVDDIRIYNRLLTIPEINELYNGSPLQITKMPDVGACVGDSVQLTSSGGTNYVWFPSTNLSASNIANPICKPTANRTYFVTVTNGSCSNKDTIVVNLNQNCCAQATSINSKNAGLLYYVPMNNESRDASASPASPIVQGTSTSLVNDRFNNKNSAYSFTDVTTDKLITTPVPKLSFPANQSFTISAWAKANSIRSVGSRIVTIFKNGGFDIILKPSLPAIDAGKIEFLDYDGGSATTMVNLTSDSAIQLNKWFLVTVTVNKDDSLNKLYINGRLSAEIKATNSVQNACGIAIGNHNLNALGFDGAIDEVRIYNSVLTQNDITDLYYSGKSIILNSDTTICSGDSVQINTYGNSIAYSWLPTTGLSDPTIPNPVAKPLTTTTYILTSNNGTCAFKDTVVITVNYSQANAGLDSVICFGDSIQLTGSGGANYNWTPATGLSATNIPNPYAKPLINTDYYLQVNTATCFSYDTVHLTINNVIANAGADQDVCVGDSVLLVATGGTSYQWSPFITLSDYLNDSTYAVPLTTTTYKVTVFNGNCSSTDSVKVNLITINPDAGTNQQICPGDSIQLQANGGTGYAWLTTTSLNDTSIANPIAKPPSTETFYVMVKIGACSALDSVKITVASNLGVNAGIDEIICRGESVQLNATGGTTFQWTPATGLSDSGIPNPFASPDSTTDYVLFTTSANCTAYDTVKVVVNQLPVVNTGNDTSACQNQPFQFTPLIINANNYAWTPSALVDNPSAPYPIATISTRTEFKLVVTNTVTGCTNADSLWVDISTANADFTVPENSGDAPFTVTVTNKSTIEPMTYVWTFADTTESYSVEKNPSYTFATPGDYFIYLEATDMYGCVGYDTTTINVRDVVRVYIPNAFTPNGDRNNETFQPGYSTDLIQKVEGTIWNRYGENVYSFVVPGNSWWDGKSNGKIAPDGVYLYEMKFTDLSNRIKIYRGTVTLLR